jgi:hypothetical protein
VRSDIGLVGLRKSFSLSTNSEPRNTTEETEFSDQTTAENEEATESGNTSQFEDPTESSNTSKSEDTLKKLRSVVGTTVLARPKPTQPPEGKLSVDCKNPETTCVTVSCSLRGPIKYLSRAHVSFSMSAAIKDLGDFTCPYRVVTA